MEQGQPDAFRQTSIPLRDEIEQLSNTSREVAGTAALDQSRVGHLSRMDPLQAQHMAQETARRRQRQQQKIYSALGRMDARQYCYCLIYDWEIAVARWEFDPASTRCINCMDD
jgi:DnaK suppressor protein